MGVEHDQIDLALNVLHQLHQPAHMNAISVCCCLQNLPMSTAPFSKHKVILIDCNALIIAWFTSSSDVLAWHAAC